MDIIVEKNVYLNFQYALADFINKLLLNCILLNEVLYVVLTLHIRELNLLPAAMAATCLF